MQRKLGIFTLLVVMFLTSIMGEALANEAQYTISELRQQTPVRWQGTYEAYGRTINIDCPVDIPDAAAFPLIHVQWATQVSFPDTFRDSIVEKEIIPSLSSGFSLKKNGPHIFPEGFMANVVWVPEPWDVTMAYAYNNPLLLGQAIDMTKQFFEAYTNGTVTISLDNVYVARNMRIDRKTGSFTDEMFGEKGFYQLDFYQTFHDIPILEGIAGFHAKGLGFGWPSPYSMITSEDAYLIGGPYMVETACIKEDLPLCGFDRVKERLEALILSGNVRLVESVRLGYVLYLDKTEPNTGCAVPSWVMRCEYFPTAKEEPLAESSHDNLHYTSTGYLQILVNAQTGALLEPLTSDINAVYCPDIITWDQK